MLAFGGKQSRQGNLTPRTLNSLSAITAEQAHEAEEEEWEREMRDWRGEDGVCLIFLQYCSTKYFPGFLYVLLPVRCLFGSSLLHSTHIPRKKLRSINKYTMRNRKVHRTHPYHLLSPRMCLPHHLRHLISAATNPLLTVLLEVMYAGSLVRALADSVARVLCKQLWKGMLQLHPQRPVLPVTKKISRKKNNKMKSISMLLRSQTRIHRAPASIRRPPSGVTPRGVCRVTTNGNTLPWQEMALQP